jgi:methanogenic corrinoid protein MtbC1
MAVQATPVTIADFPDTPQYTIKSVSSQTGVRPVTLRAWERRYAVLKPHRSDNRYRLYSDRDVAVLRWIKNRVDSGISISSAVNELRALQKTGTWPEAIPALQPVSHRNTANPPGHYSGQLYKSLVNHDEAGADDVLREAHAIYDLTTVCLEVMIPCLVKIGEAWHDGEVRITTEHFSSTYIRGKMITLLQAYPTRRSAPYIIIGTAPTEQHDIGALMLAVLLRRDGYRVEYLGPDVMVEDLVDYARYEHPALIILSATLEHSAQDLATVQEKLARLRPSPLFGFGGRIFNQKPALRERTPGTFLGETLSEAVKTVHQIIK